MSSSRSRAFLAAALLFVLGSFSPALAQTVLSFGAGPGARILSRILTVPSDGCYSLRVEGLDGAALSVVDRMYGEIAAVSASGDPSAADGRSARTTVFLEAGEYKLSVLKGADASASVTVDRFAQSEAAAGEPGTMRSLDLADGRALTFTVRVGAADPTVRFFAAGRSLGGAKLFRADGWATDVEPLMGTVELEAERPSRWIEFNAKVDPGEYRVVCWGAPALPWKGDGPASALYAMEGIRRFDEIGSFDLNLGASGLELVSVPGAVGFAQATVPDAGSVALGWTRSEGASLTARSQAETDARGGYRAATLRMPATSDWKRLAVRGKSGQRVNLRFMPNVRGASFATDMTGRVSGDVSVRALGSVEGEDSVPFTARAYALERDGRTVSAVAAERTLSLSASKPLRLEANLIERNSFLVDVADAGSYAVLERASKRGGDRKASGRWTFYPLEGFSFNRRDAKTVRAGESASLEAGRYLLAVEPLEPGPLDALVAREGLSTKLGGLGLWNQESEASGNEFAWYGVPVPGKDSGMRAAFVTGERSGVAMGVSVRAEPIDFSESPFSVRLSEGQSVRLRATLSAPSFLRASDPRLRVLVDGTALDERKAYPAGAFELRCNAADGKALWASIEARPAGDVPEAERYEPFGEGAPHWSEFARGETKRFLLRVDSPALYTVSTVGRLDTRISLRSRMRPSFAAASAGGPGRNALVSAYLKAGDYLVEVSVAGASRGAAGVALERRPVRVLPPLKRDGRVRATASAGEALAVPVRVDADGKWAVESFGLGRFFAYRFEDSLGWPLGAAVGNASFDGYLSRGDYRFISLDDRVPTRRVFTLAAREERAAADPYSDEERAKAKRTRIELGRTYGRTWRGEDPDELLLDLPAPVSVVLSLSDDMSYKAVAADGTIAAAGLGARSIALDLPSGTTAFSLKPILEDQDHGYSVRIDCPDLMEGRPLQVGSGSVVPLSVGKAGVWEIETSGPQELEAALFAPGPNGFVLSAASRQIEDDWNCVVSVPLEPGRYLLKFAVPGDPRLAEAPDPGRLRESRGSSLVRARFRANGAAVRRTGAFALSAEVGDEFVVVDFVPDKNGPYRAAAESADPTELYLEQGGRTIAYGRTEALAVLSAGETYRLRCGRSGDGEGRIGVSCAPLAWEEAAVGKSETVESAESALLVRDAKGLSRYLSLPGALVAYGTSAAFKPLGGDPFRADGAWLVRPDGRPFGRVLLPRASAGALSLPLGPGGQKIAVPVPEDSVALLRADSRGFEVSLTETGEAGQGEGASVDWSSSSVSRDRTLLGLASGERFAVVRDSRPVPDGRFVPVSADILPVVRREAMAAGERLLLEVPARSVVAAAAGRAAVRVSLERGLAAFDSGARTARTVDAYEESATFRLEELAGTLYVANPLAKPAIAEIETLPKTQAERPAVADGEGWEALLAEGGRIVVRVSGRSGSVAAYGAVSSFRFYDEESGEAASGLPEATPAGTLLSAPGRRGLLVLDAEPGFVKVFLSDPADRLAALAGPRSRDRALPLGGRRSFSGAEAREFSIEHAGGAALLIASATGDGVLSAAGPDGSAIAASGAAGTQGVVVPVEKAGTYTLSARPVRGMSRSGIATAEFCRPEPVTASGVLPERLASDDRTQAYSFRTGEEGLIGVGVRAERDGLLVRLLDSSFARIGEGPALIRKLPPGDYYLLVSSRRGTVRYRPVFFGLEGSKADVPEDIAAQYLRNGEQ